MYKDDLRKKILEFVYLDGFQKNGKNIENNLKLKKNTVEYILNKLQEEKYFSKLRYEINFDSVGLGKFAWLFISVNWNSLDFTGFIKKVLLMPQISVVADVTGKYDFAIKIFGPSIQNINAFILGFEKIFEDTIVDTHIYFANKEYKRHYLEMKKAPPLKLSKTDYQILCAKNKNPKLSLSEIADSLNLHRNTVSLKWHSYWKNNILLKKTVDLNPKGYGAIDLELKAFIILKPSPGKEEKIIQKLRLEKKAQDLFTTLANEIILVVRVSNSEELSYFYKTLSKINENIKGTNTIIFLKKHTKTSLTIEEVGKIINLS